MWKLNDKVVYSGHGIAIIDEIIEKKVAGISIKFFKLNFLYKDMTILLPINNFNNNSSVRYPENKKNIELAIEELGKAPDKKLECFDFTPSGWNKRNKEYQLKIQGGKLIEIAQIYRDLMYVAQQKELSFGEKNLLQTAEDLLIQEIQLVLNQDRDYVIQVLHDPFKRLFFYQDTSQQVTSSTI